MTLFQIVGGVIVLLAVVFFVASAMKGVDAPSHFLDADLDGEPDATPHQKEHAIEVFNEEQARRHPEDGQPPN